MKSKGYFVNKMLKLTVASMLSVAFALAVFSSELHANSQAPQILAPRLSYLDTNIGLDQNTINDIHVDKEGFVWLGTDEGLNRFDGVKVLQVLGPNLELAGNSIFHIFEHSNGLLYLSTLNGGVVSLDRQTQKIETVLKKQYAFVEQWVQYSEDMIETPDGNMIIALNEQVYKHNVTTKVNTLLFQLGDEAKHSNLGARSVYLYNDVLLVGTVGGLIAHKLNSDTTVNLYDKQNLSLDARNVKYLSSFDGESLIVGSVEGLYTIPLGEIAKVVDETWTLSKLTIIDPNRNIWDIAIGENNKAFVATDIGLFQMDLRTFELSYLFQPRKQLELLAGLDITNIALDRYSNVWMGTPKSGAMYWSPSSLLFDNVYNSLLTPQEKLLSSNTIRNALQHDTKTVFFATSNGLNKYDMDTGESEHFYVNKEGSPQYTESEVYSLASSTRQYLWLGTAAGMRKFDVTKSENVPFDDLSQEIQSLFSKYVFDFRILDNNMLWLITDAGLYIIDLHKQIVTRVDSEKSGLPIINISKFLGVDTRTNSIIVAASSSVWAIEIDTLAIKKLHSSDKFSQTIFAGAWVRGRDNSIWVSYPAHGIYKLDGDNYKVLDFYNVEHHLPTNISFGLIFDNDGDLWFSSHSGIHVLNVTTNEVNSFSFINGLAQSEFNENAYARLTDGRFVFGGYLGFSLFNPNKMKSISETFTHKTSITGVDLSSRKLSLPLTSLNGQTINLKHDDVGITLYFSSLNFDVLSQDRFQYRIITDGETINYPSIKTNEISLPLLSPGKHKVQVFAPDSTHEENIASLTINVSYPPFSSPLAYACYAVLLCLFLGLLYFRQHRIQMLAEHINKEITTDNKRLKGALLASNTNIWEWNSTSQLIRGERIRNDFKGVLNDVDYDENSDEIHIDSYISLIHEFDRTTYESKWLAFISGKVASFDISYRIQTDNGKNLWYRDVGSCENNGSIVIVKGTYTRLNSSVSSQEKLKLFGNAFKHTHDWVLIFNKEKILIATNPAFHKAFGVEQHLKNTSKKTSLMIEHQEQLHRVNKKLGTLRPGQHKKVENTITLAGKEITLLSNYSAIADANSPDDIDYYLIIATDITDQLNTQKELQKLANYDVLTGLINHTLLLDRLNQSIQFAKRHNSQLAVILIGLDNFKTVNDKYGHIAGDTVLSEIARRLLEKLDKHYTIARIEGDQFVVVVEEINELKEIDSIVIEILKAIELPITIENQYLKVSASAGIATYPNDSENVESLLGNADIAMNAAKQDESSRYRHFADKNYNN